MTKVTVIGAGGWGTTLANIISENGHEVIIWALEEETAKQINEEHENKNFLPGAKLNERLVATHSFEEAIIDPDIIVVAVPSAFMRQTVNKFASLVKEGTIVVNVSKGFERDTFKTMIQVLEEEIPLGKVIALSGPNHAEEIVRKIKSATSIASKDREALEIVKKTFENNYFKIYPVKDKVAVCVGGSMKNITALATGICYGLKLGDNSISAIITLGLSEMITVGKELGGKLSSFTGLSGVGDLIATCMSKHSRNRHYGEELGKGKSPAEIKEEMHGLVAEGVFATEAVYKFAQEKGLDLPLTEQVYKIIYENKPIEKAVKDLLDVF